MSIMISGAASGAAQIQGASGVKGPPQVQQPQAEAPARSRARVMDEYVPERCTANTDRVDREIEQLKRQKEALEQRLNAQTDETKIRELERKLAQVERELAQKDNDAYRRRHAVFS